MDLAQPYLSVRHERPTVVRALEAASLDWTLGQRFIPQSLLKPQRGHLNVVYVN